MTAANIATASSIKSVDDLQPSAVSSTASESSSSISSIDEGTSSAHLCKYFTEERINRLNKSAQEENDALNLNLGLPVDLTNLTRRHITPTNILQRALRPPVQAIIRLFDVLLSFIESPLFTIWSTHVPLWIRQKLTFFAWGVYLPIHKMLIGRRTGLHKDCSLEYHALTSMMWWGRLFPITIKRMRFSLSQLHVWHPPDR